jgi:cysteinyl-tRNA synthetase
MSIHIYNSLTRKKEEFIPVSPAQVNIYTCGVTVYDECHIGHARSLYCFDVIRRYLTYRGFKVNFVRNITDIDDKIINRANELKTDWRDLVAKFIESYKKDLEILGIAQADAEPRATENIPEMIKYIALLIEKGYAYEAGQDVYFSVRKFAGYGKLSGQSIDQMEQGARIEPSEFKKDPLDFALWKRSRENEPAWDSPWGKGRPGWHIECSVMSQKLLRTQTLDIHAGGRDLIFPHHENEIAQAEAATGKPFAKYWMHHGLLTINGQKMAKSLGNFVTVKDFIAKYKADILKLFFLSAHYSKPIDYNEKEVERTSKALERITIMMRKLEAKASPAGQSTATKKIQAIDELKNKFMEAMDDDFNMPQGLAAIFDLVTLINKNIDNHDFCDSGRKTVKELLSIFGIDIRIPMRYVKDITSSMYISVSEKEIQDKIAQRNKARQDKDFALADKIRKELEAEDIILEDTSEGTTWRRKI